jgi:hypothetical protein
MEANTATRLEASAEYSREQAQRLRDAADGHAADAVTQRRKADELELDAIEALAAANLLREAGLRVSRRPDGIAVVEVDGFFVSKRDHVDEANVVSPDPAP